MEMNLKLKTMVSVSLLLASLAIAGCGGSSGGGTTVTSPNGIYSGDIVGSNTGRNGGEKAIIYNNRMIVISTGGGIQQVFDSTLSVSSKNFTTTESIYYGGQSLVKFADLITTGTFESQKTFTANFSDANTASPTIPAGVINLVFDATLSNKKSGFDIIAGLWTGPYGNFANATLTVNSDGTFTGSEDGTGCMFAGTLNAPDTAINVYTVSATSSADCFSLPVGNYTGLAWLEGATNNTLNISFSNGTNNRSLILTK